MYVAKPTSDQYDAWYAHYIDRMPEGDMLLAYSRQIDEFTSFIRQFEGHGDLAYAEGKWTVAQLLQHLIDSERVFSYRMLRIGRGDATPLPGFDENSYASAADASGRIVEDLTAEFVAVRSATYNLIRSFDRDALSRVGTASGSPVSVAALIYMNAGHVAHHVTILRERYLPMISG